MPGTFGYRFLKACLNSSEKIPVGLVGVSGTPRWVHKTTDWNQAEWELPKEKKMTLGCLHGCWIKPYSTPWSWSAPQVHRLEACPWSGSLQHFETWKQQGLVGSPSQLQVCPKQGLRQYSQDSSFTLTSCLAMEPLAHTRSRSQPLLPAMKWWSQHGLCPEPVLGCLNFWLAEVWAKKTSL